MNFHPNMGFGGGPGSAPGLSSSPHVTCAQRSRAQGRWAARQTERRRALRAAATRARACATSRLTATAGHGSPPNISEFTRRRQVEPARHFSSSVEMDRFESHLPRVNGLLSVASFGQCPTGVP